MKKPALLLFLTALSLLPASTALTQQVPSLINYQGRLVDGSGNPVTGNRTMIVRVYGAPTGGSKTYEETIGTVAVANGLYSFRFGSAGAGIAAALTGEDYLALVVDGVEESARARLLAVPFALRSADSQALSANVSALQTQASGFSNNLATVSSNLSALQTQAAGLSGSVATVSSNVSALQNQTTGFSNNMSALISRFRVIGSGGNAFFTADQPLNYPTNRSIVISNTGFDRLTVNSIDFPAGFSGDWSSGTIAPGASQSINVTFKPTAAMAYTGNISVSSDATGGSATVPVAGLGAAAAPPAENIVSLSGGTLPEGSETPGRVVGAFQISRAEVTLSEWTQVRTWAAANGYTDLALGRASNGSSPVTVLSWYDAAKWCNARSEKEGLKPVYEVGGALYRTGESEPTANPLANGYRLPTASEWELAVRGGVWKTGKVNEWLEDPPPGVKAKRRRGYIGGDAGTGFAFDGSDPDVRDSTTGIRVARSAGSAANLVTVPGGSLPSDAITSPGKSVAAFQVGLHGITLDEWRYVREWAVDNGYDLGAIGEANAGNAPVTQINWYDAMKWCNARSEMEGLEPAYKLGGSVYRRGEEAPTTDKSASGYRLPDKEEADLAARSGAWKSSEVWSWSND